MRDPPLCKLSELRDGTYSLNDLANFHEAMDEEEEYRRRLEKKNKTVTDADGNR